MPDMPMVNIKIDGQDLQVPKGEMIIESARRINVEVPFFCYHPRLSMEDGGANCRMCVVEVASKAPDGTVRKMPKPQTACSLPATEGMEIITTSDQIAADRRGVLEFLLINHPLDCPVCDRGGECPLQNNTLHYGPPTARYIEDKRHFPKAYPLSQHVVFDRERCIHCARCTRFTTDISGDAQLNFLKRGADMEVGTFEGTEYNSRFSGNVIELCPVGALLSRDYRFKARPWDLMTQNSICTQCSNGCNIKLDYRVGKLQRVNARVNEAVNEEWTCDRGKFGMGYVSAANRITTPLLRRNGVLEPITWGEAGRIVTEQLKLAGTAVGGIGGDMASNEDLFTFQSFFRNVLNSHNLDHRMGPCFEAEHNSALYSRCGHHTMGSSIAGLEQVKAVLLIGTDLADEQPMLFLRTRKAWRFRGVSVVTATSQPTAADEFASVKLPIKPGTEVALINGLIHILFAEKLLPQASLTSEAMAFGLDMGILDATPDAVARDCGIKSDALRRAARLLAAGEVAIIAGTDVRNRPARGAIVHALANLANLCGSGQRLHMPVTQNNAQGAMDLGVLPDLLPGYAPATTVGLNTEQMLRAAEAGEIKLLWLVQADLLTRFHDPDLASRALGNCTFVVANELAPTATTELADMVLPVQSVAERDGTFTNVERRVQRFQKAFEVAPGIRPNWLVFGEVAARLGGPSPRYSVRDITSEIANTVQIYSNCQPESLGDDGVRWSYPEPMRAPTPFVSVGYPRAAEKVNAK